MGLDGPPGPSTPTGYPPVTNSVKQKIGDLDCCLDSQFHFSRAVVCFRTCIMFSGQICLSVVFRVTAYERQICPMRKAIDSGACSMLSFGSDTS